MNRRELGALGLGGAAMLAGCNAGGPNAGPKDMGNFRLGFSVVVDDKLKKIPPSRNAPDGALVARMKSALDARFGVYSGSVDYVVAVALVGYSLAPPGIPIVLSPKSVLLASANLWTETPQEKLLGPEQISAFEGGQAIIGTGFTRTADEQMDVLATNMARKIQDWLLRTPAARERFGLRNR